MKTLNLDILIQGNESLPKTEALLKISGKTSDTVKQSVIAHLVKGMAKKMVYLTYGISQQQFDKALIELNQLKADIAEYNKF
jgi:hypothetical protein